MGEVSDEELTADQWLENKAWGFDEGDPEAMAEFGDGWVEAGDVAMFIERTAQEYHERKLKELST